MNRVIKFRAWDGDKMIYLSPSGLQYFNFEGNYSLGFTVDGYRRFWGHEQYENASNEASKLPVMQFTGLHDKNGKEIYEGDVVRAKFKWTDRVEDIQGDIIMDDYMWCIDCTGNLGDDIFSINRPHEFEIIGNIYENPNHSNS